MTLTFEDDLFPNLRLVSDKKKDSMAELSQQARRDLIPKASAKQYSKVFQDYILFLADNNKELAQTSSETILAFFFSSKTKYAPSTLWSRLSAVKKHLVAEGLGHVNISQTTAFLKSLSREHKPTKAAVFTRAQIEDFLDRSGKLHVNLAILIELCGAMRKVEACSLLFSDFTRLVTFGGSNSSQQN